MIEAGDPNVSKDFYEAVKKEVVIKAAAADKAASDTHVTVESVRKVSVGGLFKTPGKGNPHKGKY